MRRVALLALRNFGEMQKAESGDFNTGRSPRCKLTGSRAHISGLHLAFNEAPTLQTIGATLKTFEAIPELLSSERKADISMRHIFLMSLALAALSSSAFAQSTATLQGS